MLLDDEDQVRPGAFVVDAAGRHRGLMAMLEVECADVLAGLVDGLRRRFVAVLNQGHSGQPLIGEHRVADKANTGAHGRAEGCFRNHFHLVSIRFGSEADVVDQPTFVERYDVVVDLLSVVIGAFLRSDVAAEPGFIDGSGAFLVNRQAGNPLSFHGRAARVAGAGCEGEGKCRCEQAVDGSQHG